MLPTSLLRRGSPLSGPQHQLALLNSLILPQGNFAETLGQPLTPARLEIFQINIGKLCNMTCRHCHVDSAPDRLVENMDRATVDLCLEALDQTTAHTVDITGGAPEMNPNFRYLVDQCVQRGKQVIDRCNLTILLAPHYEDLPEWFAARGVEVVCSLPHYQERETDSQRGDGTYNKSITALQRLNSAGYGQGDPQRRLTLMANPTGTGLSGSQACMEKEWQAALLNNYGVTFDRLIALNNMPISRHLEWLAQAGHLQQYMELLVNRFNPATVSGLMCRNTLSISWDGRVFDCDFNQMLDLETQGQGAEGLHLRDFNPRLLADRQIRTDRHCFGCTAGSGSSCGGAIK
ncbi:arsenosugar biosynthesis radical SAM (seleno)protein ArsS [Candidatus Cyanaurora vandensis]|uniref:arsenosugar biosynthesis radical SAM (seleno)protein ArsS n=1 Tax=Candidatus Cyanaurora vandensis TaxID=2714958 RepID=UPI0025802EA7|nr:arsenosugar biosynthesis radical SAM (seleno)protein ArsS [Candidatus Cyanaurora vandensis]